MNDCEKFDALKRDQSGICAQEFRELIARLVAEGIDDKIVLGGAAAGITQYLSAEFGTEFPACWFERMAEAAQAASRPA